MDTFRPDTLDNYIGQEANRRNIEVLIRAARAQNRPVDHVLAYGAAGTGKTTIARIIANEMGAKLHPVIGPALRDVSDLVATLRQIRLGDVLFIDEIHALPRTVEEVLYTAMEDRKIDIVVGETVKMNLTIALPAFSVIGATTRLSHVAEPLRARFGSVIKVEYYKAEELAMILNQASAAYGLNAEAEGLAEIARRGRGTPRVALRLLRRVGDYALAVNSVINRAIAVDAAAALGIDELGLDKDDREYLDALIQRFAGGPAGVNALASVLNFEEDDLDGRIEPWLLRNGLIERTPRGRIATVAAYEHMGYEAPIPETELMGR